MKPAKVCAVLRALEWAAHGTLQGYDAVPVQTALTVEHVLPQGWLESGHYPLKKEECEEIRAIRAHAVQTFGNLTLLTQPLNSIASNDRLQDCD